MRRSGHRILRYAFLGREEARHEIVAFVTRRGRNQAPAVDAALYPLDFSGTFQSAHCSRFGPYRDDVAALQNLRRCCRSKRFADLVREAVTRSVRDNGIGGHGHGVTSIAAAPDGQDSGTRCEVDRLQLGIERLEDEPGGGERRMATEIDFALRSEPAKIEFSRSGLHEI